MSSAIAITTQYVQSFVASWFASMPAIASEWLEGLSPPLSSILECNMLVCDHLPSAVATLAIPDNLPATARSGVDHPEVLTTVLGADEAALLLGFPGGLGRVRVHRRPSWTSESERLPIHWVGDSNGSRACQNNLQAAGWLLQENEILRRHPHRHQPRFPDSRGQRSACFGVAPGHRPPLPITRCLSHAMSAAPSPNGSTTRRQNASLLVYRAASLPSSP